jgi:hypothetical protein
MDEYIQKYNQLHPTIVYHFPLGVGGIGDCIKFFIYTLHLCIQHNIRLLYKRNHIPLEKYLRLQFDQMYFDDPLPTTSIQEQDIPHLTGDGYYYVVPSTFYSNIPYDTKHYDAIAIPIRDVFYFSDEVIHQANQMISLPHYISIHLRLGDKHLETDHSFVHCKDDVRPYDENSLFHFIEQHSEIPIVFFCDNQAYKLKIKQKYHHVAITNCNIGHTSLSNTTDEQVLDTVAEFYILTASDSIYYASISGFPIIASKFNHTPLERI